MITWLWYSIQYSGYENFMETVKFWLLKNAMIRKWNKTLHSGNKHQ